MALWWVAGFVLSLCFLFGASGYILYVEATLCFGDITLVVTIGMNHP